MDACAASESADPESVPGLPSFRPICGRYPAPWIQLKRSGQQKKPNGPHAGARGRLVIALETSLGGRSRTASSSSASDEPSCSSKQVRSTRVRSSSARSTRFRSSSASCSTYARRRHAGGDRSAGGSKDRSKDRSTSRRARSSSARRRSTKARSSSARSTRARSSSAHSRNSRRGGGGPGRARDQAARRPERSARCWPRTRRPQRTPTEESVVALGGLLQDGENGRELKVTRSHGVVSTKRAPAFS
jgi:hypothetical protein